MIQNTVIIKTKFKLSIETQVMLVRWCSVCYKQIEIIPMLSYQMEHHFEIYYQCNPA